MHGHLNMLCNHKMSVSEVLEPTCVIYGYKYIQIYSQLQNYNFEKKRAVVLINRLRSIYQDRGKKNHSLSECFTVKF